MYISLCIYRKFRSHFSSKKTRNNFEQYYSFFNYELKQTFYGENVAFTWNFSCFSYLSFCRSYLFFAFFLAEHLRYCYQSHCHRPMRSP
jgi:hypothetical protein